MLLGFIISHCKDISSSINHADTLLAKRKKQTLGAQGPAFSLIGVKVCNYTSLT